MFLYSISYFIEKVKGLHAIIVNMKWGLMMENLWDKDRFKIPLLIILSVTLTVLMLLFTYDVGDASLFNGVAALYIFTYLMFPKRDLLFVGLPFLILQLFSRLLYTDANLALTLLIPFSMILLMTLQAEMVKWLMQRIDIHIMVKNARLRANLFFFLYTIILALVSSIMMILLLFATSTATCNAYQCFIKVFSGEFLGLYVILPVLYLSYRYDDDLKKDKETVIDHGIFFAIFFATLLLFVFIDRFSFNQQGYIFVILFIVIAYKFSYRTLLFYLILSLYFGANFVVRPSLSFNAFLGSGITFLVFVAITSIIAVIIKRFLEDQANQQKESILITSELNNLLDYVYDLLKLSKALINEDDKDVDRYHAHAFDVAIRLFQDVDAAYACAVSKYAYRLVKSYNYGDESSIPYYHEMMAIFADEDASLARYNVKEALKQRYGDDFMLYQDRLKVYTRIYLKLTTSYEQELVIVIDQHSKKAKYYEVRYKQFLGLISQLFKKYDLSKRTQMLKDDIILSFVRTLELYDAYTKGHSEDVAVFSEHIANQLGLESDLKKTIYYAGLLHDIGKVGVDYDIINKPGKLTDTEYEAVKKHVMFGYHVMQDSSDLKAIADIVKHHHEWWDGGGYPEGLKGDSIPLGAQIISVADAVATMATSRPYRKRLNKTIIINELKKYKGKQFAPKATDMMIKLLEEGLLERHYKEDYES